MPANRRMTRELGYVGGDSAKRDSERGEFTRSGRHPVESANRKKHGYLQNMLVGSERSGVLGMRTR